jgi:hypothetical protein
MRIRFFLKKPIEIQLNIKKLRKNPIFVDTHGSDRLLVQTKFRLFAVFNILFCFKLRIV